MGECILEHGKKSSESKGFMPAAPYGGGDEDVAAKKAAIAAAASILTTVYHMLRDGTCYQDLGPEYFTRRNPAQAAARLANRIRNLVIMLK